MKSTKRPSTLQMMKQASIPSSPAISACSQATSSSSASSSLSSSPSMPFEDAEEDNSEEKEDDGAGSIQHSSHSLFTPEEPSVEVFYQPPC